MMALARLLLDAGLIQFGWFQHEGESLPFTLHLDMLASYPTVLELAVREAQDKIGKLNANRILCTSDAIPFGVAFSLRTGIPLVYSRGTAALPVFDLVGAYDIGHPALLLTNTVGWENTPAQLVSGARQVGLEVHTLLTILEARPISPSYDLEIVVLLRLADVVRELAQSGGLTLHHAQAVLDWIGA